jgi:hypothetical protein
MKYQSRLNKLNLRYSKDIKAVNIMHPRRLAAEALAMWSGGPQGQTATRAERQRAAQRSGDRPGGRSAQINSFTPRSAEKT